MSKLSKHRRKRPFTAGKEGSAVNNKPSRVPKASKGKCSQIELHATEESDSDTDQEVDEALPPRAAYENLISALKAEVQSKAPRASCGGRADAQKPNSLSNSTTSDNGEAKKTQKEPQSSPVDHKEDNRVHVRKPAEDFESPSKRRKKAALHQEGGEEEVQAEAKGQLRHLERTLSEADIAAFRNSKLAEDSSQPYEALWPGCTWLTTGAPLPEVHSDLQSYDVRQRLMTLWREEHPELPAGQDFVDQQQSAFLAIARSYKDILYTEYPYPSSPDAVHPILDAAMLHCLDHVSATAQRIKKTNEALKADPDMDVPRDQGFTRPKVLILLPMRNMARNVVTRLLKLMQKETRVDSILGKTRFLREFGSEEAEEAQEGGTERLEKKPGQSDEHYSLFSDNIDDHFRMGIKVTRGSVRLYADFFQSDIIIASPIGLATQQAEAENESPEDKDFLSSIEIVVAARCDVFLMQNWAHVITAFKALNTIPKDTHGVDVMRVFDWCLSGKSANYRQNILLTSFVSPEMNALFTRFCQSHAGRAKLQPTYKGVLGGMSLQLRQVFERILVKSPAEDADARFEHFKRRLWPRIRDSGSGGQLIFVSSYFDYVRLRSFFRAQEVEFEGFSEYASGGEVARGRSKFAAGKTRLAIYTERAHFYHRRRTKGVKDLYVYQLPEHAHFYTELVSLLADGEGSEAVHNTVSVLFSKYDALRLERVVGSSRAPKMLKSATRTFLFC